MWPTQNIPFRYWPILLSIVTVLQTAAFFSTSPEQLGLHMSTTLHPATFLRAFTSLFAHSDVYHLLTNALSQLFLGLFVECIHGHGRFLVIYVVSGVGGALTYRMWWCTHYAPTWIYLVGASGAVYGLMGAYAAHLFLNWAELRFRVLWFVIVLFTFLADIGLYVLDGPTPNVAYAAHVGGAVYGLCSGVLTLRNARVLRCERVIQVVATLVACGLTTTLLALC